MTIMLIYWAELPIDLFFDEIRWHHHSFKPIVLVLLQKDVLIERCESLWESEWVPYTFNSRLSSKLFLVGWSQKMISQGLNCQYTLETRIQVAEVRIVLQPYYSIGKLFHWNLRLFLLFFLCNFWILSWFLCISHIINTWSTCKRWCLWS